jgi:hypothetical protein
MLPHAKVLRNVGLDTVGLSLRSMSLHRTAVLFIGWYFEEGPIDLHKTSVSSALGVSPGSGGGRRLMLSWEGRGLA